MTYGTYVKLMGLIGCAIAGNVGFAIGVTKISKKYEKLFKEFIAYMENLCEEDIG